MQLQTQQMEQQLQETAGELAEVERELQRRLQFSAVKFTKTAGLPRAVSEESDLGPGTPPALHPARATQDESSTAGQPPRPAYEALSREFDAVMQACALLPQCCLQEKSSNKWETLALLPMLRVA